VKIAWAMLASIVMLIVIAAMPSVPAQMPSGRDVVAPAAYASFDPVARGSAFQLAVVLKIRPGFHINARQPSEEYLIPTDVRVELPAGFKAGDVSYPKGELHTFSFSKKPLNVYEDKVVIRMALSALADAPLGQQHIPFKVHYQACSVDACLPPVTLAADAAVNVAAQADGSRPAHPELFSAQHTSAQHTPPQH
jgi:DsbC/DsbD-like thiol-disulfide interchange protein